MTRRAGRRLVTLVYVVLGLAFLVGLVDELARRSAAAEALAVERAP